jgi:hypothetical protein
MRFATSLRFEIDQLTANAHVQSKINSKNSQKTVRKHFSNEMKIHFFFEDTHLPPKISECISSHLITRTANENHSYCKRETSLTKFKNSQSVMILVVRFRSAHRHEQILLEGHPSSTSIPNHITLSKDTRWIVSLNILSLVSLRVRRRVYYRLPKLQNSITMSTPARDFLLETPWRIIIPNPNVNSHSLWSW